MKLQLLFFVLFLFAQSVKAQEPTKEKKIGFSITAGYAEKLDQFSGPSRGFHLGVNMYKANSERLGWDTQLAFNLTDDTNSSSTYYTPMVLGGGRYYFTPNDNAIRFFVNFLAGFALELESGSDFNSTVPDVGYSVGVFAETRKLVFGASVESPENLVIKVGLRL